MLLNELDILDLTSEVFFSWFSWQNAVLQFVAEALKGLTLYLIWTLHLPPHVPPDVSEWFERNTPSSGKAEPRMKQHRVHCNNLKPNNYKLNWKLTTARSYKRTGNNMKLRVEWRNILQLERLSQVWEIRLKTFTVKGIYFSSCFHINHQSKQFYFPVKSSEEMLITQLHAGRSAPPTL